MVCQLLYVVLVVYWWCVTGEFMSGRSLGDVFVQTLECLNAFCAGVSRRRLGGHVSVMLRLCGILMVLQYVAMGIQWYLVIVWVVFLLLVSVLVKHQTHITTLKGSGIEHHIKSTTASPRQIKTMKNEKKTLVLSKESRFFLAGVFFLFERLDIFSKFWILLATDVQKCKLHLGLSRDIWALPLFF